MKSAQLFLTISGAALAVGCGGEEIKWTEDVRLRDGKVVQVQRRTELSGSGFPVSKRGFEAYHEMCYAPLGAYWKSKPEYRPDTLEIDGGKAYVKVTLLSFNNCGLHGYPKDSALYFIWSGSEWKRIDAGEFPRDARLNLLHGWLGNTAAGDARGNVGQAEKEKRDASIYYSLKVLGVSGLNETPPYKGMCSKYPVDKSVAPPPPTSIFLPSQRKRCD